MMMRKAFKTRLKKGNSGPNMSLAFSLNFSIVKNKNMSIEGLGK